MVTDVWSDFVVGHGELWSAKLFSLAVGKHGVACKDMDTREVMIVTSPDGKLVDIEYRESDDKLDAWARRNGVPEVQFITTYFIIHFNCSTYTIPAVLVLCLCNDIATGIAVVKFSFSYP